jgi:hypothetical protein
MPLIKLKTRKAYLSKWVDSDYSFNWQMFKRENKGAIGLKFFTDGQWFK